MDTTTNISRINARQPQEQHKRQQSLANPRPKPTPKTPIQQQETQDTIDNSLELSIEQINEVVAELNAMMDPEKLKFDSNAEFDGAAVGVELKEAASVDVLLVLSVADAFHIANTSTCQDEVLAAASGKLLSRLV